MSRQLDYKGKEYSRALFTEHDFLVDENRIDGDALLDKRVIKSDHQGGGECDKCGYTSFNVNNGKEYCGLCNEFYDTYKYIREQSDENRRRERMIRSLSKEAEKARREGDFVKQKELEQALIMTQLDNYENYSKYNDMMTATEVMIMEQQASYKKALDEMHRKAREQQDRYLAKQINMMRGNQANYTDIW